MSSFSLSFPGFICQGLLIWVRRWGYYTVSVHGWCRMPVPLSPHPHYPRERLKLRSKSSGTCGWDGFSIERWLGGISVRGRMVQVDKPLCLHDFGLPNQYSNPGLIAGVTQNEPLTSHHKSSWLTFNVYQLAESEMSRLFVSVSWNIWSLQSLSLSLYWTVAFAEAE